MTEIRAYGRFGETVAFDRVSPDPRPNDGIYDTEVQYGGRRHAENYQVRVYPGGVSILGRPVHEPRWNGLRLTFGAQPDAEGGTMPWAGEIVFQDDGFSGWCQFPGQGPVEWYGRRLADPPPAGDAP